MTTSHASPWLESLTSRLQESTFFLLKGDTTAVLTACGSRPGSSWADLVFAEIIGRVLERRNQLRSAGECKSTPFSLAWDGQKTLDGCPSTHDRIEISEVVWADDLAVPRLISPALAAAAALGFETSCLADTFREYGFTLAFGPHKTAGVLAVRGEGSRRAKRDIFGPSGLRGSVPVLLESQGVRLLVVSSYKHLGTQQSPAGVLKAELVFRIQQVRATFAEGRRKVYRAAGISPKRPKRKAHILNAPSCRSFFMDQAHGARSLLVNLGSSRGPCALAWPQQADDQHVSSSACFSLLGLPSPQTVLRYQRLLYLAQLVVAGPVELWATIRADRACAELLQLDLDWLHSWTWRTSGLPCPRAEWQCWLAFMTNLPRKYKCLLKRARALDGFRHTVVAAFPR